MPHQQNVLNAIKRIQDKKQKARISPHYALYTEISCAIADITPSEIKQALNSLCKEKSITHGRTINNQYFAIIDH